MLGGDEAAMEEKVEEELVRTRSSDGRRGGSDKRPKGRTWQRKK